MISIQLRHHFLCSPLFLFSPPHCMKFNGGDYFSAEKKEISFQAAQTESDTDSFKEWIFEQTLQQHRDTGRLFVSAH